MDWKKVSWKGARAFLGGLLAVGGAAAIEAMLGTVDTAEELTALGAPVLLIPVLLAAGASVRNWMKHRKP